MRRSFFLVVAAVLAAACGEDPMGPEEALIGVWNAKSSDDSGIRHIIVSFFIDQGATDAAAGDLVDEIFSFPYNTLYV